MRPFSLYLDEVKNAKPAPLVQVDLSGSTPPIPSHLPASVAFDATESRKADAYAQVIEQIAGLTGRTPLLTVGSSSAYLHALSAVTRPGDQVVIEKPTYEPFVQTAKYLGLKIERFERTGDWERDLANLRRAETKTKTKTKRKTRNKVLIISNPNAPTGFLYTKAQIAKLTSLFDHVIVDEVFLPIFTAGAVGASGAADTVEITRTGSKAISLSGLSKTLGLSSLRVGWILAPKAIQRASDRMGLNTYTDVPTLPLIAAAEILPRFHTIVGEHGARVDANRASLKEFGAKHPGILSHDFTQGHFGTLKIPRRFKTATSFAKELAKRGIKVAAGEPFDAPKEVRISAFADANQMTKALETISTYY
jgi:aspartate/methionine/tyrosine aminotransferase